MKQKIIFLTFFLLSVLTTKGQQQLSYAYDAAGNRINRTIVVGAYNPSVDVQHEPSRFYVETLEGRTLSIHSGIEESQLTIAVGDYDTLLTGEYSILDKEGILHAKEELSKETTLVELEELPSGSYTLNILLNGHLSRWEVFKL